MKVDEYFECDFGTKHISDFNNFEKEMFLCMKDDNKRRLLAEDELIKLRWVKEVIYGGIVFMTGIGCVTVCYFFWKKFFSVF